MEARKITVVSTKDQKKSVIMSEATTLGELKRDLDSNNIDYDGMTFYEGTSKTELRINDAILPYDVPYKGNITNELVFLLTNPNKKIKSGIMSRSEIYEAIKTNNLQGKIKEVFGKNFTTCKTEDLVAWVAENTKPKTVSHSTECVDKVAREAISRLAGNLYIKGCISSVQFRDIRYFLENGFYKDSIYMESPYSDDELDDMFEDLNND